MIQALHQALQISGIQNTTLCRKDSDESLHMVEFSTVHPACCAKANEHSGQSCIIRYDVAVNAGDSCFIGWIAD